MYSKGRRRWNHIGSINKVIMIGNTTRNTELRTTESGKSVANMRLATNRQVNGAEQTQFHTVICWDRLAETVAKYATKGRQVYVEGRLEYRAFLDDEGKERGVVEIVARDVQFLGSRPGPSSEGDKSGTSNGSSSEDVNPDDVPF